MSQEEQEQEEPHPNQTKPSILGMVKEKAEVWHLRPSLVYTDKSFQCRNIFKILQSYLSFTFNLIVFVFKVCIVSVHFLFGERQ